MAADLSHSKKYEEMMLEVIGLRHHNTICLLMELCLTNTIIAKMSQGRASLLLLMGANHLPNLNEQLPLNQSD